MGRPSERRRAPRGLDEAARRGRPRPGRAKKKKKVFPFDLFCVHSEWNVRSAPLRRHPPNRVPGHVVQRQAASQDARPGWPAGGREGGVFVDEARSTAGSIDSGLVRSARTRMLPRARRCNQPGWPAGGRWRWLAGAARPRARASSPPSLARQPAAGRRAAISPAFHPRAPARGARPATALAPKTLAFRSERSQTGWLAGCCCGPLLADLTDPHRPTDRPRDGSKSIETFWLWVGCKWLVGGVCSGG